MPNTLDEEEWELLLRRIKKGKCTPFIGAGACFGTLPLATTIAQEWAKEYKYPLSCAHDLARIAQYIAVKKDPTRPKELIQELLKSYGTPNFKSADEIHGILADLPLPIYITTNYDDFMVKALLGRDKHPQMEFCRWNSRVKRLPSCLGPGYLPSVDEPLVFHLHGHAETLDSIVITEDDYLDFLISLKSPNFLPTAIEEAFANTTLLFLGYRLADWDFRVLFRSLVGYLEISGSRAHISVQILPLGDSINDSDKEMVQTLFDRYFRKSEIRVYWGTCQEFVVDLRQRWEVFSHDD